MNTFINLFKNLFTSGYTHQRFLTFSIFALCIVLNVIMSYLSVLVLSLLLGLIIELTYCFVPMKQKSILGINIKHPDYKSFFDNFNNLSFENYHKLDTHNLYYVYLGLILFTILKIVFMIF